MDAVDEILRFLAGARNDRGAGVWEHRGAGAFDDRGLTFGRTGAAALAMAGALKIE